MIPYPRQAPQCCRLTGPAAGFTLIEIALATLLIGLGVLAIFGLGRLGLQNARESENDTRAALLAEDVFATLRVTSEALCRNQDPAAWSRFWSDFASGATNFDAGTLACSTLYSNSCDDRVFGDGRLCTNYLHAGTIPEWAARFSLAIEQTNTWADVSSPSNAPNNAVRVTLSILPGLSGADSDPRTFYTHFVEHGSLP